MKWSLTLGKYQAKLANQGGGRAGKGNNKTTAIPVVLFNLRFIFCQGSILAASHHTCPRVT